MAYRASKHAATGLSPNMMTFGREINLPMTAVIGRPPQEDVSVEQHIESIQQKLVGAHEQARQSLQKQAAYQKRHYDKLCQMTTILILILCLPTGLVQIE